MTCPRAVVLFAFVLAVAGSSSPPAAAADGERQDAFHYNRQLGRGVNLGNALEAPREGEWGIRLEEKYFDLIKQAGFDSVRIPIRWSAHAAEAPPYEIDEEFFQRVDWAIEQALSRGLAVVINMHHYDELYEEPAAHKERFLAQWRQIADRYKELPDTVYFEILNEPHEPLGDSLWNEYFREALQVVRRTNPERMVIVGPAQWNAASHLRHLQLPDDDRRLIVTFHYYLPFRFTHQGASWAEGSEQWLGTTWTGTEEQQQAVREDFDMAARWAERHNRPLYLGEFGAYSKAPLESRANWTRFVREEAEKRDMSWAYWEFASGFGIYDPAEDAWREKLLRALLPGEEQ